MMADMAAAMSGALNDANMTGDQMAEFGQHFINGMDDLVASELHITGTIVGEGGFVDTHFAQHFQDDINGHTSGTYDFDLNNLPPPPDICDPAVDTACGQCDPNDPICGSNVTCDPAIDPYCNPDQVACTDPHDVLCHCAPDDFVCHDNFHQNQNGGTTGP